MRHTCLRINGDLVIVGEEIEPLFLSPIDKLVLETRSSEPWFVHLLKTPVQGDTFA